MPAEMKCKRCGKVVILPNWLARIRKFCSKSCSDPRVLVDVDVIRNLYGLGLSLPEVAEALGTTIKVVYSRMVEYKIPRRSNAKRNQLGERNSCWKGEGVGYKGGHIRVTKYRGKPKFCEICGTKTAKRFEWANMNRKYNDPFDYRRLCCSCHRKLHHSGLNFHRRDKHV